VGLVGSLPLIVCVRKLCGVYVYMCFLEFFEEGSSVFVTVYCIFLITT
jgi:hypothetical protein